MSSEPARAENDARLPIPGRPSPVLARRRLLIGCCLLSVGLGLAAWFGVYTPPVVRAAHDPNWTLASSCYPEAASIAAARTADGIVLRGLHVPADPGAPLIVHFAGAGVSVTSSPVPRLEFHQLATAGFASLAIDYRGVGLSAGTPDASALAVDAAAIYDEALRRVHGDPSQLLLRGTSLGTIAIAALLGQGRKAESILLFAPVLADTVAIRWGHAVWNSPWVSLASPFLRRLPAPSLPTVLRKHHGGLFVYAHPEDELLIDSEYRAIAAATEARGGTRIELSESARFRNLFEDMVVRLPHHARVCLDAASVEPAERAFLITRNPALPPVGKRVERTLNAGAPSLAQAVRKDPAAMERLRDLVGEHLGPRPNSLLAVAAEMPSSRLAGLLLRSTAVRSRSWLDALDPSQLRRMLDRSDPSGPIPALALVTAAAVVADLRKDLAPLDSSTSTWPVKRVLRLAKAVLGEPDGAFVFRKRVPNRIIGSEWCFAESIVEADALQCIWRDAAGIQTRATSLRWIRESLTRLPASARRRLLVRVLCKAACIDERVVPSTGAEPTLLVQANGKQRAVDCERLELRD